MTQNSVINPPDFTEAAKPISFKKSSPHGVLVVHGITSTPGSMAYLCERFATAGYDVECPLLPGHGTKWQDLAPTTRWQWLTCTAIKLGEMRATHERVFVVGLSLGAGLALRLAQLDQSISGLVLVNPLVKAKGFLPKISGIGKHFIRSVPGVASDIKAPGIIEPAYTRVASEAGHESVLLAKEVRKNLHRITSPALIFQSVDDHVLPPEGAALAYKHIASKEKELVWLRNSFHVATMDYDKDLICDKSIEFFVKRA